MFHTFKKSSDDIYMNPLTQANESCSIFSPPHESTSARNPQQRNVACKWYKACHPYCGLTGHFACNEHNQHHPNQCTRSIFTITSLRWSTITYINSIIPCNKVLSNYMYMHSGKQPSSFNLLPTLMTYVPWHTHKNGHFKY